MNIDEFAEVTLKRAASFWQGVETFRPETLDVMSWRHPGLNGFAAAKAMQETTPVLKRFPILAGEKDSFVYGGTDPAHVQLSQISTRESISSVMTAAHELGHALQYSQVGFFVMQRLKATRDRHLALEADAWLKGFDLAEQAGLLRSDEDRQYARQWARCCWATYEQAQFVVVKGHA